MRLPLMLLSLALWLLLCWLMPMRKVLPRGERGPQVLPRGERGPPGQQAERGATS